MRKIIALIALAFLLLAGDASYATGIWTWNGSSWSQGGVAAPPKPWAAGAWQTGKRAWVWAAGVWKPFYSTITVSASNTSNSGSGASSTGTVSAGTSASIGGNYIGSPTVAWQCTQAPCASINNSGITNPTWTWNFSGVGCQSSQTQAGLWRITATDPATGAQAIQNNVSVSLTWNNTTSCLGPFTLQTSGSSNSGSGFFNSYTWNGNAHVTGFNGGPVSGNMSYSWTYVSGDTASSTSGANSANLNYTSSTQFCGPATTCNNSSTWNVHVVDLVSGYSADAQVFMYFTYTNDSG